MAGCDGCDVVGHHLQPFPRCHHYSRPVVRDNISSTLRFLDDTQEGFYRSWFHMDHFGISCCIGGPGPPNRFLVRRYTFLIFDIRNLLKD